MYLPVRRMGRSSLARWIRGCEIGPGGQLLCRLKRGKRLGVGRTFGSRGADRIMLPRPKFAMIDPAFS